MTEAERRSLRGLVATLLGNPTPFEASDLPLPLVRRHLLAPLAHTQGGVAAFRNDYIASSLQAERRAAELATALDALSDAHIPVILLKGIAYAGTLYPDPAERPMSDIDLLVRSSDIPVAERALTRLGYWRAGSAGQSSVTRHAITLKRRDGSIDLHRHILHPGRTRIDLGAIWRDAHASHVSGALRLSPIHEYLLHIAHIGRHEGDVPVLNYVDAVRLRTVATSAEFDAMTRSWALMSASRSVLRALDDLQLRRKAPPDRFAFPAADEILEGDRPPRWLQVIRKLRLNDDWRGIVALATAALRSKVAPFRARAR